MRATNLMYRCPKEQTPDAYNYRTLNDGSSLDFHKKDNLQNTFGSAPRFLEYKTLANRTQSTVGPGSYNFQIAINRLRQKACMVKLQTSTIDNEQYYELVNNIRVFQPQYLAPKSKKSFEKTYDHFIKTKSIRSINQSYLYQKAYLPEEKLNTSTTVQNQKSRNVLINENFDFKMHERPKTQENLGRRNYNVISQYSNYNASQNNLDYGEGQIQSQQDLLMKQNGIIKGSHQGHTLSMIDKDGTTFNGSTNASLENTINHQPSFISAYSSKKSKSIKGSEFGLRIRQTQGSKKSSKKYVKAIKNNNYFIDASSQYIENVGRKNMNRSHQSHYMNQPPNINSIEVDIQLQQ